MSPRRLIGTAAAVAAAVALLSTGATSYAGWVDTTQVPAASVVSGQLRAEPLEMTVDVDRGGVSVPSAEAVLPGDVLTYRVPVRVLIRGDLLGATLALDTSAAFGPGTSPALEDALTAAASVHIDTELPPVPGQATAWRVTPADHGTVVTAVVTTTVPDLVDMQGQRLDPGRITWSLDQDAPTATGWRSTNDHTAPAVAVDALALDVPSPTAEPRTTVTNTAQAVTGRWAPTAVRATVGGTDVLGSMTGTRLDYAVPADGSCADATPAWTALPAGAALALTPAGAARLDLAPQATAALCLSLTEGTDLVRTHAGRALSVSTTLAADAAAPSGWRAADREWTTEHTVDVPAPAGLRCWNSWFGPTTVSWSWPSPEITRADAAPAVTRWELIRLRESGRDPLVVMSSTDDSFLRNPMGFEVRVSDSGLSAQSYKIRAHTADGHRDSEQTVQLRPGLFRVSCSV